MQLVCVDLDEITNTCLSWAEFVPPDHSIILTAGGRDTLLLIVISLFLSVFIIRSVIGLIQKPTHGGHYD